MSEYQIYNMECIQNEFCILGYKFTRVTNYHEKLPLMHRRGVISNMSTKWVDTVREAPGTHQYTYTAIWDNSEQEEPDAKIYKDGKIIQDILLLWTLWNNRLVCTGNYVPYQQHHYYNEKYFVSDYGLIKAIDYALSNIDSHEEVIASKIFPTAFLMQESNLTPVWQYKILYLSPSIDVCSKSISCKKEDFYSAEDLKILDDIKKDIAQYISEKETSETIDKRAIQPFKNKISTLGSVTAVDQLFKWVKWSLNIDDDSPLADTIFDHCIAFNKFRNSIVHYAGLPKGKITIRLKDKIISVSKKIDTKTCTGIGIFYFYVFNEILHVWLAKKLDVLNRFNDKINIEEIIYFFETGEWRDAFPFEGVFEVEK